jgi:hypothetical protein
MSENRIIKVTSGATNKGAIKLYELTGNGSNSANIVAPDALASDATITLPDTTSTLSTTNLTETITGIKTFSNTLSVTGTFSVAAQTQTYGFVPLGAVLPTFPNITGAYNCIATTVADANGFVLCNGQIISDVTSPLNGQTIPNLNDDIFLMGSSSASGASGGANSKDLSHTHTLAHTHGTDTQLSASTSVSVSGTLVGHTHNLDTNGGAMINSYITSSSAYVTSSSGPSWTTSSGWNRLYGNATDYNLSAGTSTSSAGLVGRTAGITSTVPTQTSTGTLNLAHSHTTNSQSTSTTSSTLSSTQDFRPKYITTKYIMRIK